MPAYIIEADFGTGWIDFLVYHDSFFANEVLAAMQENRVPALPGKYRMAIRDITTVDVNIVSRSNRIMSGVLKGLAESL